MPEMNKIRKIEYDPIIFPCNHCRERFSSITTYEMHFRYVHSDVLVRQQLHKLECQQTVVNSLKLQVQTLKQTNTETERHLSYVNNERARETKDFETK